MKIKVVVYFLDNLCRFVVLPNQRLITELCTFIWHVLKVHYQGFIISNSTKLVGFDVAGYFSYMFIFVVKCTVLPCSVY